MSTSVVHRPVIVALLCLLAATPPAIAGSGGSLRTGSGGTGISSHGGSGGTGLSSHGSAAGSTRGIGAATPTHSTTPSSGTQQQMTPAKPHATPPAGVRPHTDLAAASKLIQLSSGNLIKRSALFPKMPLPPGDPSLSGPVLNSIGPTQGGSASFKAVAGIPTDLSNGRVYPTNGGGGGGGKSGASLGGATGLAMTAGDGDASSEAKNSGGGLLVWLQRLLTLVGVGGLSWWLWTSRPKGARIALPALVRPLAAR